MPRVHLGRCGWFWFWALVGGLVLFSVVSYLGVLTGLPALAVLVLVAHRSPAWPEPLGLAAGFGMLALAIAYLNRTDGGVDPAPWLAAGIVLLVAAVMLYALARRSSR